MAAPVHLTKATPMAPDRQQMVEMGRMAIEHIADFRAGLRERPVDVVDTDIQDTVAALRTAPPRHGWSWPAALAYFTEAAGQAVQIGAHPRDVSHMPSGGLYTAVLGRLLAAGYNRYAGVNATAPGLRAIEQGMIGWLATDVFGLPPGAGGTFTGGSSDGTARAVIAARDRLVGEWPRRAVVYLTDQAHHSVWGALHAAAIPAANVRIVPTLPDLRMDVEAAERMIRRDRLRRGRGQRPALIVSTAGTTPTGVVDDLATVSALATRYELWHHVDGAYGGAFALTRRGRALLEGVQQADSIVFDQHKGWSHPYGLGTLLVARLADLQRAYTPRDTIASYLPPPHDALPEPTTLGPELTRPDRVWEAGLPLWAHGHEAFAAMLDAKLDLAQHAYHDLAVDPLLDVPFAPDLTIIVFRLRDYATSAQLRYLAALNASGKVYLSPITVRGQLLLRLCILAHTTEADDVAEILRLIHDLAREH